MCLNKMKRNHNMIFSRHIPCNPHIPCSFLLKNTPLFFILTVCNRSFDTVSLNHSIYCGLWLKILLLDSLSFRKMVIGESVSDRWIDTIDWKWTDGSIVISLTRILWSMIDTIGQKEKIFNDVSILLEVSMTNSINR
jgi:hypothetical protein